MMWGETGLRWVMPSPNMPLPETALVYPGQVLWEGTNLSEGRGTTRPFEIFGAPFLDTKLIKQRMAPETMEGCHLQEISFRPTFNKWGGEICRGFMIHLLDHRTFRPYFTALALLRAVVQTCKREFEWKPPPYEYEYERMPIDLILGDPSLRPDMEGDVDLFEIKEKWDEELGEFLEWRRPYLIYR